VGDQTEYYWKVGAWSPPLVPPLWSISTVCSLLFIVFRVFLVFLLFIFFGYYSIKICCGCSCIHTVGQQLAVNSRLNWSSMTFFDGLSSSNVIRMIAVWHPRTSSVSHCHSNTQTYRVVKTHRWYTGWSKHIQVIYRVVKTHSGDIKGGQNNNVIRMITVWHPWTSSVAHCHSNIQTYRVIKTQRWYTGWSKHTHTGDIQGGQKVNYQVSDIAMKWPLMISLLQIDRRLCL